MKKIKKILIISFLFIININFCYASYLDVDNSHWAVNVINYLSEENVINGYPDKMFKPSKNITREEFMKMLVIARGYEIENNEEYWATPYINKLKEMSIIDKDISKEILKGEITRYEVCDMIFNTFDSLKNSKNDITEDVFLYDAKLCFSDIVNYSDDMKKEIYLLKKSKILSGYEDGSIRLSQNITRAELCSFIYKIMANKEYIENFKLEKIKYESGIRVENIKNLPLNLYRSTTSLDKEKPLDVQLTINDIEILTNEEFKNKHSDWYSNIIYNDYDKNQFENSKYLLCIKYKIKNDTDYSVYDSGVKISLTPNIDYEFLFSNDTLESSLQNYYSSGEDILPKTSREGFLIFNIANMNIEEIYVYKEFRGLFSDAEKQIGNIPYNDNRQGIIINLLEEGNE